MGEAACVVLAVGISGVVFERRIKIAGSGLPVYFSIFAAAMAGRRHNMASANGHRCFCMSVRAGSSNGSDSGSSFMCGGLLIGSDSGVSVQ